MRRNLHHPEKHGSCNNSQNMHSNMFFFLNLSKKVTFRSCAYFWDMQESSGFFRSQILTPILWKVFAELNFLSLPQYLNVLLRYPVNLSFVSQFLSNLKASVTSWRRLRQVTIQDLEYWSVNGVSNTLTQRTKFYKVYLDVGGLRCWWFRKLVFLHW